MLRRCSGRLLGLGRPAACSALQGSSPAAAHRLSSSVPADGDDGETLLQRWRTLLSLGGGTDADVRELLDAAMRLRQAKPSALPEQLLRVFMAHFCQLGAAGRASLLRSLAGAYGVRSADVDAAAAAWAALRRQQEAAGAAGAAGAGAGNVGAPGPEPLLRAAARLRGAATPPYAHLFVPLSQQPGGIKFLVDLRAELLQAIQAEPLGAAPLRAMADALRACLAEWFSVGLLQLRRISWEASPAELLEKVAAGEAVHDVASWRDLKGRLDPATRRVFAFFHEAMPGEPLVVLHTALTAGVPSSMAELLPTAALAGAAGQQRPQRASAGGASGGGGGSRGSRGRSAAAPGDDRTWGDEAPRRPLPPLHPQRQGGEAEAAAAPTTAVFYSISATQKGLAGVDLGNFLIKQVAQQVQAEFPSVRTLCTLSPLPGFSDWVAVALSRAQLQVPLPVPLLLPEEAVQLEAAAAGHVPPPQQQQQQSQDGVEQEAAAQQRAALLLGWALADDNWLHNPRTEAAVQQPLMRLAAHYLLRERRRGLALDPVANFHLRNGARVLRLNWRADLAPQGLRRSHGVMVNYEYIIEALADNNRAYLVEGAVRAAPQVEALLGAAATEHLG